MPVLLMAEKEKNPLRHHPHHKLQYVEGREAVIHGSDVRVLRLRRVGHLEICRVHDKPHVGQYHHHAEKIERLAQMAEEIPRAAVVPLGAVAGPALLDVAAPRVDAVPHRADRVRDGTGLHHDSGPAAPPRWLPLRLFPLALPEVQHLPQVQLGAARAEGASPRCVPPQRVLVGGLVRDLHGQRHVVRSARVGPGRAAPVERGRRGGRRGGRARRERRGRGRRGQSGPRGADRGDPGPARPPGPAEGAHIVDWLPQLGQLRAGPGEDAALPAEREGRDEEGAIAVEQPVHCHGEGRCRHARGPRGEAPHRHVAQPRRGVRARPQPPGAQPLHAVFLPPSEQAVRFSLHGGDTGQRGVCRVLDKSRDGQPDGVSRRVHHCRELRLRDLLHIGACGEDGDAEGFFLFRPSEVLASL
mmetsp:Transcript_108737/g.308255  ORF Transcript_108737/g.308255 Transcript_108737/m.308255 type:complete len:414 (-) Transcript_108737:1057-2298(-)